MSYTNAGFTGNDGTESSGWDPLEVQHFKDIENSIVGDAVGSVKDTAGHKHNNFYDQTKVLAMQALTGAIQVKTGYSLVCNDTFVAEKAAYLNALVCLNAPFLNTSTGENVIVDAGVYNSICWKPSTTAIADLVVTLTNPTENQIMAISIRGSAVGGHRLTVAGVSLIQYAGHPYSALLYYTEGAWSHMQGNNA
jgi:hypothetical protein